MEIKFTASEEEEVEFAAVDAENALNVAELSEGDEALSKEITGVLGNLLGFVFNALANAA